LTALSGPRLRNSQHNLAATINNYKFTHMLLKADPM